MCLHLLHFDYSRFLLLLAVAAVPLLLLRLLLLLSICSSWFCCCCSCFCKNDNFIFSLQYFASFNTLSNSFSPDLYIYTYISIKLIIFHILTFFSLIRLVIIDILSLSALSLALSLFIRNVVSCAVRDCNGMSTMASGVAANRKSNNGNHILPQVVSPRVCLFNENATRRGLISPNADATIVEVGTGCVGTTTLICVDAKATKQKNNFRLAKKIKSATEQVAPLTN